MPDDLEAINYKDLLVVVNVIFVLVFAQVLVIESTVPKVVNRHLDERDEHLIAQVVVECNDAEAFRNPEEAKAFVKLCEKKTPRNEDEQIKFKVSFEVSIRNRDQVFVLGLALLVDVLQEKMDEHVEEADQLRTNDHPEGNAFDVAQCWQHVHGVVWVHNR